jgi:o-succinylbenzoate synthase
VKVLGAELLEVRLPLRDPFTSSSGVRSERRLLLLRVRGSEGLDGWGECVAGETPAYSYETTETAWNLLERFVMPGLVGREVLGPEEILGPVGWIRGHPMAKAAAEMAMWDLQAKEQELPLWELLGGSGDPVPVGVVVGLQPGEAALLTKVEEGVERGYAVIKIKIEPGRDVEMLGAVRKRFPEAPLAADANGAYALDDDPRLDALDDLGLLMLEQPLDPEDLLGLAKLQTRLRTPLCLDESIRSRPTLELALELGACRMVSLKAGPLGGLGPARELERVCRTRAVPARCGGMLESGIGRAHNLALATLPGFVVPGDISESRRYWECDLVAPEFELEGGRISPHPGPGIGVEPDLDRIRALTVRRATFGSLT